MVGEGGGGGGGEGGSKYYGHYKMTPMASQVHNNSGNQGL